MSDLSKLTAAEEQHLQSVEQVKQDIIAHIKQVDIPGVTRLNDRGPVCFSVRLSTVKSQPNMNLSAEFYNAEKQADYLQRTLASCKTATDVTARINSILQTGAITVNKETCRLHPAVLDALQSIV